MGMLSRRRFMATTGIGLTLGAAGCLEAARRTEWPAFRRAGDNSASTREHPGSELEVGWELDLHELFASEGATINVGSPIGDTDTVYLNGRFEYDGDPITAVASVNVADGSVNWTRQTVTGSPIDADALTQPAVLWDELILATGGQEAIALERDDGFTPFTIDLPWLPTTTAGGDRALVAFATDEAIAMLDLDEDQAVRWTHSFEAGQIPAISPLTVLEDSIYITIEDRLIRFRRGDGEQVHDIALLQGSSVESTPPLVDGYHLFVRLHHGDGVEELIARTRDDLEEKWRIELGNGAVDTRALPAYRSGRLYAAHGGTLIAVQVGNGDIPFETEVEIEAPYPTIGGDSVYLLGADDLVIVDRHAGDITDVVELPGEAGPSPQEALPRNDALIVVRQDRVLGLQPP